MTSLRGPLLFLLICVTAACATGASTGAATGATAVATATATSAGTRGTATTTAAAASEAPTGADGQRLVQPGAPGEASRVVGMDAVAQPLPHTPADARFMQQMIVHHSQALIMSRLARERTTNPDILLVAQRIEISQVDEIELAKAWLERRGESVPPLRPDHTTDPAAAHHEMMPGMLTDQELERLASARGAEFDRLFLSAMIRHHEGALAMVAELFATPGAVQEDEVFTFASHVESDQRIEIARMNRMLGAIP